MGRSMKWVEDNLGVTRYMVRYYEEKELLPANPPNKYHDFSDEDINRIWGIKLLIGMGFSTTEIYALMNDPDYDFRAAIVQKVAELERRHDETLTYLNFAKSIKFTGRIPTVSKIGSMKFDDFIEYAHKNWNFCDDPSIAPFMEMADTIITKDPNEWSPDDVACMVKALENFDADKMILGGVFSGYFQVISDMRDFGYSSDVVQRVVRSFHEYLNAHGTEFKLDGELTVQTFVRNATSVLINGDIGLVQEQTYGKEECLFIAQAIAYYGGYNIDDL